MVKIYTKTGDKGVPISYGGKRVSKADLRVEAYGEVDELNSLMGILISQKSKVKSQNFKLKFKSELVNVQKDLLTIGSLLANPILQRNDLQDRAKEIESLIDELSKGLSELKNFILPGGGEVGSLLHFARSVCRRAERRIVTLSKKQKIDPSILVYFNRLSDLLFIMARFVNYKENKKEIVWESKGSLINFLFAVEINIFD
ncbi:MAG: cob(I)yrinic acid a,c-diamide adenosyltransferase [Patescibacteria group bacterium]|nr:cob(I)yrinic acid a,c-diamide adenosyltransferase [Patescibacteria group bacterium]